VLVSRIRGTFSVGPRHKEGGGSEGSLLSPSSSERGSHMTNCSKRRHSIRLRRQGGTDTQPRFGARMPDGFVGACSSGRTSRWNCEQQLFGSECFEAGGGRQRRGPDLRRPAAGHLQEFDVTSILGRRAETQLECPIHRNNFHASGIDKPTWRTPCNFTHSG